MQKIQGFEYVKNLPLSVGLLLDTSASMLESLPEAQQAALAFLDYSIGAKDRAFVVSFDNEPYLLSKLTSRKDKLVRSLSGLRAEGSTALYDAIIYGLYQFTGREGQEGARPADRRQGHRVEVRLRHAARVRAQVGHCPSTRSA